MTPGTSPRKARRSALMYMAFFEAGKTAKLRPSRWLCLALATTAAWRADITSGQGTFVFNTGGGQSLVTETRTLAVPGAVESVLQFMFGFGTDETPAPGVFLDSFTVSIQDAAGQFTAVYLTADANGLVWAPTSPGALVIDPSAFVTGTIPYPALQPLLANRQGFQVSAPIPAQFAGASINVFFDFFDNQDAKASQAWFSNLAVTQVPEPGPWTLLLLGAGVALVTKRFRR